jgi:hypothetical protein
MRLSFTFFVVVIITLCHATAPAISTTVQRQGKAWARKATGLLSTAPGATTNTTTAANNAFACDSLVPEVCGYPFPNDFFRDVNGSGLLNLTSASMPLTVDGRGVDPVAGGWDLLDGFSPLSALLAYFPNLNIDTLPRYWDIQASLDDNCPTVLVRLMKSLPETKRRTYPFLEGKPLFTGIRLSRFKGNVVCAMRFYSFPLLSFRCSRRRKAHSSSVHCSRFAPALLVSLFLPIPHLYPFTPPPISHASLLLPLPPG